MRIGGLAPPLLAPSVGPGAPSALSTFQRMSQYRLANQRLLDMRRAVLDVNKILGPNPLGIGAPAQGITLSGVSLGLDTIGARTTVSSQEEVNADTTSFDNRQPAWETVGPESTGSMRIKLDGVYVPKDPGVDEALYFRVDFKDGVGSSATLESGERVWLRVYDSTGEIGEINLRGKSSPQTTTLANGLDVTVEFSDGVDAIAHDDQTENINLFSEIGSALDPTKPFNGTGSDDAVLEDGESVQDGSFDLTFDGTTTQIDVFASDSLNDVLGRINGLGLGVTASYDAATERVTVQADDTGPGDLVLANDTSQFLRSMKLQNVASTPGFEPEDTVVMSSLAAFAGVTTGTVTINDQTVAVEPSTQSLQDVLALLNDLEGVTASFTNNRVTITGEPGVDLTVADDSGLLGVLDIATGSHEAIQGVEVGLSADSSRKVAKAMRRLALAVDAFVADQLPGPKMASGIQRLRSALATEFASVFEAEDGAFSALGGMRFDFSDTQSRGVSASLSNERRLVTLLDKGDEDTLVALLGDGDEEPGLLERLDTFTRRNLAGIQETLGVGSLVDLRA